MNLNRYMNLLIPIIAIVLGLVCGAIIMLVSGYDPIAGYSALWYGIFGEPYYIGETVRQVTPYILTGLAVAFAFRTGLFNIGVEGQVIVGWLAAVWVGIAFELDEIMNVSDRIAVIYEGKIVDIVDPKETTEQELGLLMAGSKRQKEGELS